MSEVKNAIIESVSLFDGDRGFLTSYIMLDYGGMSQGFGGYTLYLPKSFKYHGSTGNFAGHFIWRVMEVAGATDWNKVTGKTVRARIESGLCVAIGHIVKEDWFNPKEDFEAMKGR